MPSALSGPSRHPPGLYVLFFTELWERYSFYSMMAILTLYMDEVLRFDAVRIGRVYGAYLGGVYLMPLAGGLLADRMLGFSRAVVLGGVIMTLGHLALALDAQPAFYGGLALLACGSGLLKPNVSTLVGNLYRDRPALRDAGFNIFYMGINLGGLIAPLGVAWLRARFGWGVAFGSAALAMVASLVVFVAGRRWLDNAVHAVSAASSPAPLSTSEARERVLTLLVVFLVSAVFWLAFYQSGFTLTLFARDNVRTSAPPETFQAIEPLGVILFSGAAAAIWTMLRTRGSEPSTPVKMLAGILIAAAAFVLLAIAGLAGGDTTRVSPAWLVSAYLTIAHGEVCLSPMGLSLVSRVAPPRTRGVMMGAWFVSLSAGGYASGVLGRWWILMPHSHYFLDVAATLAVAALVLAAALPRIRRVVERVDASEKRCH
ncbi:MAG: peptide MFS transporter [Vicinamibacterales bacterium]